MTWKPQPHTLTKAITRANGETLEVIELAALTVAQHREALAAAGDDDDDQFEALIMKAAGLTVEEVDQILRPDYLSLAKIMGDYVNLSASAFLGKKAKKFSDPNTFELLVPIEAIGRTVEHIALQVPAMRATKAMRKLPTPKERTDFITAHCTGLSTVELDRLCLPDWTRIQERLFDFLNKPAAYFQSATST